MKLIFHLVFLCLPFLSFSQISFEYVLGPEDFSIGAVRQSPIGEYFVQGENDTKNIYTSMDGLHWTKASLPVGQKLRDMQFYTDGTPLLKPNENAHLIRRNGIWYTMNAGGGDLVETSFIKDDTLFMYYDARFSYSLDTGQTFTVIVEYDGDLIDHSGFLWKFDNHFILVHTAGTQNRLSVFNMNGDLVLSDTLDIFFGQTRTYNSCGQMLFNDEDNYYLLHEDGLAYESGPVMDILPPFGFGYYLQSQDGHYFIRHMDTLYKSNGCNFQWEFYAASAQIESKEYIWLNHLGEIFLYDTGEDYFTVETNGVAVDHYPDIYHPDITDVDESSIGFQCSVTSNDLFRKNVVDDKWIQLDSSSAQVYQVEYSPGGQLYVVRKYDILYSTDNGHSFSTLPLPNTGNVLRNFFLEVLDDHFLFLISGSIGNGFYTINNGQDWIDTGESFYSQKTEVKGIGDDILIVDIHNGFDFARINTVTGETITESFDRIPGTLDGVAAILDDGTFYVQLELFIGDYNRGYYSFRFGEALKYLGPFSQLSITTIAASGNDLFGFGLNKYYLYNGQTFIEHYYGGLPTNSAEKFILSENEYLYVITNQNRIYRSTQPLSLPVSTKDLESLVEFCVFPNPTNNEISLRMGENDLSRIEMYEIIDQLGQVVFQSDYLNNENINVTHLIPGIYNLILKKKGISVGMKKFVRL